jgi:hypothetical protein
MQRLSGSKARCAVISRAVRAAEGAASSGSRHDARMALPVARWMPGGCSARDASGGREPCLLSPAEGAQQTQTDLQGVNTA